MFQKRSSEAILFFADVLRNFVNEIQFLGIESKSFEQNCFGFWGFVLKLTCLNLTQTQTQLLTPKCITNKYESHVQNLSACVGLKLPLYKLCNSSKWISSHYKLDWRTMNGTKYEFSTEDLAFNPVEKVVLVVVWLVIQIPGNVMLVGLIQFDRLGGDPLKRRLLDQVRFKQSIQQLVILFWKKICSFSSCLHLIVW